MIEVINKELRKRYKSKFWDLTTIGFFAHVFTALIFPSIIVYCVDDKTLPLIASFIVAISIIIWVPIFNKPSNRIKYKKQAEQRLLELKKVLKKENMDYKKDIVLLYKEASKKSQFVNFKIAGLGALFYFVFNPVYSNSIIAGVNKNLTTQFQLSSFMFFCAVVFLTFVSGIIYRWENISQYKTLKIDLGNIRFGMKTKKLK